jgi:hypothetical protein
MNRILFLGVPLLAALLYAQPPIAELEVDGVMLHLGMTKAEWGRNWQGDNIGRWTTTIG